MIIRPMSASDAAISLRGLAGVIRKHGTCAPMALEVIAERLEATPNPATNTAAPGMGGAKVWPPRDFEEWFAGIEAGDGTIPVPQSIADGDAWHEHIGRRQIALGAWEAALAAQPAPVDDPVAWSLSGFIHDDDGRPIGTDEPRISWGAECPDETEGWSPLYGAPAQPAPVVGGDSITTEMVEAVECEVGMSAGAWDMVDPRKIIAAARATGWVRGWHMEGDTRVFSITSSFGITCSYVSYDDHLALLAARPGGEARPRCEWHEDKGPVVWWAFPVEEPSWIGTPNDDDWPGNYLTHWTPHPPVPAHPAQAGGES